MLRTRVKAGPVAGLVMSVLFALALTAIQSGDRYIGTFSPKMGEPAPTTLRVPYGPRVVRDRSTGRADVHYEQARIVVPRGEVLKPNRDSDWTAYTYESRHRPPKPARLVALFSIFFTLAMGLTAYLRRFGHQRLRLLRVQSGLLVATTLIALVAKALLLFTSLSEF